MSLLNMMLAGNGGGGFKTATPTARTSTSLSFSMGGIPREYVLMLTFTSGDVDLSTARAVVICDTETYSGLYTARTTYEDVGIGNVTKSFESGTFKITLTSGSFATSGTYILYYK